MLQKYHLLLSERTLQLSETNQYSISLCQIALCRVSAAAQRPATVVIGNVLFSFSSDNTTMQTISGQKMGIL